MIPQREGWSRMTRLAFSAEDQQALLKERFEHPHPRVQQRMEVLWLISQGLVYPEAARLAGVSEATVDRYVAVYRQGGLDALRELHQRVAGASGFPGGIVSPESAPYGGGSSPAHQG